MVIGCEWRRARTEAAAIAYASPWRIPVERLCGIDAVKALLLATTAKVVEGWDEKAEERVEASVAKVFGGVRWGKEVECVANAMMEFSAIVLRCGGERSSEV